jgi:hypothetical protein
MRRPSQAAYNLDMRTFIIAAVLLRSLSMAAQQPNAMQPSIAITFDDMPVHGPLPSAETRVQVARSILATLRANQMPPVYGFMNARRLKPADPVHVSTDTHSISTADPDYAFLTAWGAAGQPLGITQRITFHLMT